MRARPSPNPEHFDSDREALPFPRGGVFAAQAPPVAIAVDEVADDHANVVAHIDHHLAALQRNLDALAGALDDPIPFTLIVKREGGGDYWPPAAA
jgi:hypothetical protein